jgi:RNA polymerase sigma-70 factor (ECF subfamily)
VVFDDFYREHYSGAVRLALSLTGRMSLAEEFAQDAFVSAHGSWDRVAAFDRPDLWLRRVLVNRCMSGWRRTRTERRLVERLHDTTRSEIQRRVEAEPGSAGRDAEVWRAVRSLPRRQAQVIALRYLDDLTTREIGEVLGCSDDTVRTHERRARIALAQALAIAGDAIDDEGGTP